MPPRLEKQSTSLTRTLGKPSPDLRAADTYDEVAALRRRIATMDADLARRQESYIRRERAYNLRVEELEEELAAIKNGKTAWMREDKAMKEIKMMHSTILGNVDMVQDRTAKVLQEQERDLLRAFRARLFDVQTELEKEKKKKDDGSAAWIERTRRTEAELDWAKEMADRLDRVNQSLGKESKRLKSELVGQNEDRTYLIQQLVQVKKENTLMRQELTRVEAELKEANGKLGKTENALNTARQSMAISLPVAQRPVTSHSTSQLLGAGRAGAGAGGEDYRYRDIIRRLKKLLETERRNLRQVRAQHAADLQERTELEKLLRDAALTVRKEIEEQRRMQNPDEAGETVGKSATEVAISSLTAKDQTRTLELLLSQERVISLLYQETFPMSRNGGAGGSGGGGNMPGTPNLAPLPETVARSPLASKDITH
ncbi:unnamed protein product [Chrysoparadoxa australica]